MVKCNIYDVQLNYERKKIFWSLAKYVMVIVFSFIIQLHVINVTLDHSLLNFKVNSCTILADDASSV